MKLRFSFGFLFFCLSANPLFAAPPAKMIEEWGKKIKQGIDVKRFTTTQQQSVIYLPSVKNSELILQDDTRITANRVILQGKIFTQGKLFEIKAEQIHFAPQASIHGYQDIPQHLPVMTRLTERKNACQPPLKKSDPGKDFGQDGAKGLDATSKELHRGEDGNPYPRAVFLQADQITGTPHIYLKGQRGGDGWKGCSGGEGGDGHRGANAHYSTYTEEVCGGFNFIGICVGGHHTVTRCASYQPAGFGGDGGDGGKGGLGGLGGQGGSAIPLQIETNTEKPASGIDSLPGQGGKGGDGGDGGLGGQGAKGGDGGQCAEIHLQPGSHGSSGSQGLKGEKGPDGYTGKSQSILWLVQTPKDNQKTLLLRAFLASWTIKKLFLRSQQLLLHKENNLDLSDVSHFKKNFLLQLFKQPQHQNWSLTQIDFRKMLLHRASYHSLKLLEMNAKARCQSMGFPWKKSSNLNTSVSLQWFKNLCASWHTAYQKPWEASIDRFIHPQVEGLQQASYQLQHQPITFVSPSLSVLLSTQTE